MRIICEQCGSPYEAQRSTRRFCAACVELRRAERESSRDRGSSVKNARRNERRLTNEGRYFVGIDGEGVDRPDGKHEYVLLGIGDEFLFNPDYSALEFDQVLSFICDYQRSHPLAIQVGFFLSYDFSQWFKTLPANRAEYLLSKTGIAKRQPKNQKMPVPFPVSWGPYEFDILGTKRFKVRIKGRKQKWTYVLDTSSFFQTSFLKVLKDYDVATDEEWSIIEDGKQNLRGITLDYGEALPPEMFIYTALENALHARVMSELNKALTSQDVRLKATQWFGPGQAAQNWLNTNAKEHTGEAIRAVVPDHIREKARATYYGGWFEVMAHGIIPGPIYAYDINSAYPMATTELPCLLHGDWIPQAGGELELWHVAVKGSQCIGPLQYRSPKGAILRPHESSGWHWSDEVLMSVDAGLIDEYTVNEVWSFHRYCDCNPPLTGLRGLYNYRIRDGGKYKNTVEGKAIKLVINSMYGKLAQSIGNPRYSNPIYASRITSYCRRQIMEAIATHPDGPRAVYMVATDGVFFGSPHPSLPLSAELGHWEESIYGEMCINKPGLYWLTDNKSVTVKSRGVGSKVLEAAIADYEEQWIRLRDTLISNRTTYLFDNPKDVPWPETDLLIPFSVVTPSAAMNSLHDWSQCGAVRLNTIQRDKTTPAKKRYAQPFILEGESFIRTNPLSVRTTETTPYDGTFGETLGDRIEQLLDVVTQEGSPMIEFAHYVKGLRGDA